VIGMAETSNVDVTATVPTDHQIGDPVHYSGALGEADGVVAEVRDLFDEAGAQLRAFVVRLEGVGRLLTSGDALSATEMSAPIAESPAPTPTPVETAQLAQSVEQPPAEAPVSTAPVEQPTPTEVPALVEQPPTS
jgi:hypothetical protein